MDAAYYQVNQSPHTRLDEGIPKEKWSRRSINLNHLRMFECTSFVHIGVSERGKLDAKAKKMVFLGYL